MHSGSLTEFWQFFFAPAHEAWFRGAVWGNVAAVIPLGILGLGGLIWHRGIVAETRHKLATLEAHHAAHAEVLLNLLDFVDPDTTGGLGEQVTLIADRLDETTPHGVGAVLEELRETHHAKP